MTRRVKLNQLTSEVSSYDYPLASETLADDSEDVTLVLAEGEVNLAETIRETDATEFTSPDDVLSEVMNRLPRNAVGEPFQSEGEG
jgi:hypothetical protein